MSQDWAASISLFIAFMVILWASTAWVVFVGEFEPEGTGWWKLPLAMTGIIVITLMSIGLSSLIFEVLA